MATCEISSKRFNLRYSIFRNLEEVSMNNKQQRKNVYWLLPSLIEVKGYCI